MQKSGVLSLKMPDIEIELSPQSLFPETKIIYPETKIEEDKPEYSDEDLLLWSAPGVQ